MKNNPLYAPTPNYDTKTALHFGVSGTIIKWDAERAFGVVQTTQPPLEIFFHIKNLVAHDIPPTLGETVTVQAKYDSDKKRWRASQVSSPKRNQIAQQQQQQDTALFRPMRDKLLWAIPIALIWFVILWFQAAKLAQSYLLISLLAFALYAWDKRCALNNGSRIPENSLHAMSLLGGWAGALVARYVFRHKTQKQPFVGIFWATVVLNVAATVYFLPQINALVK